jgi:hypothetical protein
MTPQELLKDASAIIDQRGEGYGGIENNFQLAADLASLRLGRDFHPYEIAIILACVKNARAFASPDHMDSHIDAVNYELFAATFAADYTATKAGTEFIDYQKKADRKPAKSVKPTRAAELSVIHDHVGQLATLGESA